MGELILIKNVAVVSLLDKRHIFDDDIKQVIKNAEESGEKLYAPEEDKYLAKMWLSEAMFYVEYTSSAEGYVVHSAYTHRSEFVEEE